MPLNTLRWKGVNSGTLTIVGENGGRQINEAKIHRSGKNTSVNVNLAGLPCGLYWLQLFNTNRNRRSDTRAWFVSKNSVNRLILEGPNPPLGEPPL